PFPANSWAIPRHNLEISRVYGYIAFLFTYVSACNPETKTKCPLLNAPTFCKTSSTSSSVIFRAILQRFLNCAMQLLCTLSRRISEIVAGRGIQYRSRGIDNHSLAF